ncbi:hypothetical protein SBADM41S_12330 [Streptomyces badius]
MGGLSACHRLERGLLALQRDSSFSWVKLSLNRASGVLLSHETLKARSLRTTATVFWYSLRPILASSDAANPPYEAETPSCKEASTDVFAVVEA